MNITALPQHILLGLVKAYRLLLSPWLGNGCHFEPTCSAYALQALEQHGAAKGSYLTLKRISRCHPWCDGGSDPVPHTFSFFANSSINSSTISSTHSSEEKTAS